MPTSIPGVLVCESPGVARSWHSLAPAPSRSVPSAMASLSWHGWVASWCCWAWSARCGRSRIRAGQGFLPSLAPRHVARGGMTTVQVREIPVAAASVAVNAMGSSGSKATPLLESTRADDATAKDDASTSCSAGDVRGAAPASARDWCGSRQWPRRRSPRNEEASCPARWPGEARWPACAGAPTPPGPPTSCRSG